MLLNWRGKFSRTWLVCRPFNWINIYSCFFLLKPVTGDVGDHVATVHGNFEHLVIPSTLHKIVSNTCNSESSAAFFFCGLSEYGCDVFMILLDYLSFPLLALAEWSELLCAFKSKYSINWPSIVQRLGEKYRLLYIF